MHTLVSSPRNEAGTIKNASRIPMAGYAGLESIWPATGFFARRRTKRLKEIECSARDIMVMGSTGFHTFVDPQGALHNVLKNCRGEAKVMLLDPLREGTVVRARSIPHPDVSPELFREQIIRSIDFLKGLKEAGKNVRLKLYPEAPLLKLAVLGDNLSVRFYHTGVNARNVPEYLFRQDQKNPGSLFDPFYRYFLARWSDPNIPEYDLDTDEFVYRERNGNETRREKFSEVTMVH